MPQVGRKVRGHVEIAEARQVLGRDEARVRQLVTQLAPARSLAGVLDRVQCHPDRSISRRMQLYGKAPHLELGNVFRQDVLGHVEVAG